MSIAHLAGALGKPVWVVLQFAPDWRWMLERDDSPWYPTMRLFRQKTRGEPLQSQMGMCPRKPAFIIAIIHHEPDLAYLPRNAAINDRTSSPNAIRSRRTGQTIQKIAEIAHRS